MIMEEIVAPGPLTGLVATIVGMSRAGVAVSDTMARTVEAQYRLTWAGWQLESLTFVAPDGSVIGRYSASHVDMGPLPEAPPLALAWADQHNPGNFNALPLDPNAAAEVAYQRGQADAMTLRAALTEADRRRQS